MPILLMLAAAAATAAPDHLRPARSSPPEMAAFAMARVCLPMVRDGAAFETLVRDAGSPWKAEPGAYALNGTTPNIVQPRGQGCYFRIDRGDPDRMRGAVVDAVTAAGAGPRDGKSFDSGPAGGGPLRQEAHCLTAANGAGVPLALLISRKVSGRGPALQASIFTDARRCAP